MNRWMNTHHGRKLLFSHILSEELADYDFKIDAFFESVEQDQILSLRISDDQTFHLGINLAFREDRLFSGCSQPLMDTLIFRAYFITQYLHCLQHAKEAVPHSYFSGLVVLNAITDRYTHSRTVACAPRVGGKNRHLRPIDVHCAIRAITRLLLDNDRPLVKQAKQSCETYRDALIAYTGCPEVEYGHSRYAQYTVLCEVQALRSLVGHHPLVTRECALFQQVDMGECDEQHLEPLLSFCDANENPFWPGMILRLCALDPGKTALRPYIHHPCLQRACRDFWSNSTVYYRQGDGQHGLGKDNRQAIQRLARGIEQSMDNRMDHTSGTIHYIR